MLNYLPKAKDLKSVKAAYAEPQVGGEGVQPKSGTRAI
jgi:hypothetical protein